MLDYHDKIQDLDQSVVAIADTVVQQAASIRALLQTVKAQNEALDLLQDSYNDIVVGLRAIRQEIEDREDPDADEPWRDNG